MSDKIELIFPTKTVKCYKGDQEWMTEELRKLRRQKSREYIKHKNSDKFRDLQKKFTELKEVNSKKYVEKEIEALKNSNIGQFYRRLKKLGSRLGECEDSSFSIPSHVEENLNKLEIAEQIASHFSSISQEYPPLDIHSLPPRVKSKILDVNVMKDAPIIGPEDVYSQFCKRKLKQSCVPGDIPPRIKKEFAVELASPVAHIFNAINQSGQYPRQWVIEWVTPIPKVSPPDSLDDLRNISLTADLSKDYENFLLEWITPYIKERLDPGQFGGAKGSSIVHYLIILYNFILSNSDRLDKLPKSVLLALVDFRKGFNRLNHNKIIIRLSDWGVPGWILKILSSYLTERSMVLRHGGVQSSQHQLPGRGPQGALLGILCFIVEANDAGMDPPPPLVSPVCPGDVGSVPFPPPACVSADELRLKYIDDLSMAETVQLKTKLSTKTDGTGLFLPPNSSRLQQRLDDLTEYVVNHDMALNTDKTKIMSFNFTRKYNFVPELSIDGVTLEVVTRTKLLGVICTSDCKWKENTRYIVTKATKKLWFMRRLKNLGASNTTLVDVYRLFVRANLEFSVPLWSGALTSGQSKDIERVQRTACAIILGKKFTSYEEALDELELVPLAERRRELCTKFALKCTEDSRFQNLFPRREGISTRTDNEYIEPFCRTNRYRTSAVPYLINLLNDT